MGLRTFTFAGTSSSDYNLFITEAATYNLPERAVEMLDVPGRNGAYALDLGKFENVEVTYHVVVHSTNNSGFQTEFSDVRNWLASHVGYQRLEDDYNSGVYRMAIFKGGLETSEAFVNGAEFDIVFECKPQRWLTSGETPTTIGEWGETETLEGDVVQFDALATDKVKSLVADIDPTQDLHGYDAPWVGGAGKNKYPTINSKTTDTINGVKFTRNADGSITVKGTASAQANFSLWEGIPNGQNAFSISAGTYTISATGCSNDVGYIIGGCGNTSGLVYNDIRSSPKTWTVTIGDGTTGYNLIRVNNGANVDTTIYIQWESGSSPTTYEPYENICPISGHDDVTVTVADDADNPTVSDTYTTTLPSTTYGGTLDLVSGELTVTHGNIASYNGETLPSTWISDRDVYASGTTPTTGAQVVYELANPTTTTLTPQQIELLLGTNNIWADTGDVMLEYGQNPMVLVNPTPFEAEPLLAVDGYGTIGFNGYEVEIENVPIGDIVLYGSGSSASITLDESNLNVGDAIRVNPRHVKTTIKTEVDSGQSLAIHGVTPTLSCSNSDFSVTYSGYTGGSGQYVFTIVTSFPSFSIVSGTDSSVTNTVSGTIAITGYPQGVTLTISYTQTFTYTASTHTLSYATTSISTSSSKSWFSVTRFVGGSPQYNSIVGDSTKSAITDTVYIDCDIGECYTYNSADELVSLNGVISLGSDLPKLSSGTNTFTYDNTVTELNVTPRWWKV